MFGGNNANKQAKQSGTTLSSSTTLVTKDSSKDNSSTTSGIGKPIIQKPMTKIISDTDLPASSAFGLGPTQSKTAQKSAITFPTPA